MVRLIKLGVYWDQSTGSLVESDQQLGQDLEEGPTLEEKSKTVYLDIMNSICGDLRFTIESGSEYDNNCIPTLDFKVKIIWVNLVMTIKLLCLS